MEIRTFIGKPVMLKYINPAGKQNEIACQISAFTSKRAEIMLLDGSFEKELLIRFSDIKEIKPL